MAVQHGAKRVATGIAAIIAITFLVAYAASLPTSGSGATNSFTTMEDAQIADVRAESMIISGDVGLKAPSGLSVRQTDATVNGVAESNLKTSGISSADGNTGGANQPSRAGMGDQVSGKSRLAGIYGFQESAIASGNVSANSAASGSANVPPSSAATSGGAARGGSSGSARGVGATGGASSNGSGGGGATPSGASAHVASETTRNSDETDTFTTMPAPIAREEVPVDTNGSRLPANDSGSPASDGTRPDFLNNAAAGQPTALDVSPILGTADPLLTDADPLGKTLLGAGDDASDRAVPDVGSTVLLLGLGMAVLYYSRNVFFLASLQLG